MESYGIPNEASLGEMSNNNILNINRNIAMNNARLITKHQNDVTNAVNTAAGTDTLSSQAKTIFETGIGQVASKGKDIEVAAKVISKAPSLLVGKQALGESSDVLSDTAKQLLKLTTKGANVAEKAKSLGTLGLGAAGLSVGLGALDALDDFESQKIEGNNSAEKISNVAGIASGGLEALGTTLDLTGIGAPVGVALNLLGGLTGLVSAGAELIGEGEEKAQALKKSAQVQAEIVPQQKQIGVQDTGSSGAQVKSN
tara:strand:+ start:3214 stop:3981 length:768 start_codon:yes stop_codon:yes gene_type:complete